MRLRLRGRPRSAYADPMVAMIRQDEVRTPPHSVEAEQAVLGGLMLDTNAWDAVADIVVAADFYRRDHRLIFEAIIEVAEIRGSSDAVTDLRAPRAQGPARGDRRARLPRHHRPRHAVGGERPRATPRSSASARSCASWSRRAARSRPPRPTAAAARAASSWTRPSAACSRSPSAAAAAARVSSRSATSCRRPSTGSTAAPEPGRDARRADRLHAARPQDHRLPARRPDRDRGPPVDGQDDARHEHRRERRDREGRAGRRSSRMEMSSEQLALR